MYYVRQTGDYIELIDSEFSFLYPDIDFSQLATIDEQEARRFKNRGDKIARWNGERFDYEEPRFSEEEQAQRLAVQRGQIWEKIKECRYQRSLLGVYVASVDKWFQTSEEEKTKYLGLAQVINELGEITWKTYDNAFISLTPELLKTIFAEMVKAENQDHINAEKHKAALYQAANPLEYDYSTGWVARYPDGTEGENEV